MWCMQKTEVYSWRLSRPVKARLEEEARSRETSLADLLDQIVREWLESSRDSGEEERQQQLRAAAMKLAGSIEGEDPERSENVRSLVRARLAQKYGR